jgi:hypothetical protein
MEYAQQAHLIRAIKYAEPGHLQKVERDHRRIIKAMEGKNRDALVEVVRNHLPDSRDAYLRAYALRHGIGPTELQEKNEGLELATRDEISRSNRWFTIGRPLTVWLQEMRTIRAVGKIFHTEIAKITKICCTTGKSSGTQS